MNIFFLRMVSACLATFFVAGCVGSQIKPDAGAGLRLSNIHFVPMESPPMQIAAANFASGSASIVHFLPRYTIGMARAVGVLSGISVLLELSASSHRKLAYPQPVEPAEAWLPSVEFAREGARLLTASGRTPTISPEIQPIPGVEEKGRTTLMENWMAPIRSWYNDERPAQRYASLHAKGVEAVAELGISNYEILTGKLLLQIHVKLIDPASGKLLGRARASSFTEMPPMDELFADDAKLFKESVSRAGNPLVTTCLQDLGIATK